MSLVFRNLSTEYRIGFSTQRGRPVSINLRPGETQTIEADYMTTWSDDVKQEVAAYVGKGVLSVYDTSIPGLLTEAAIIAF